MKWIGYHVLLLFLLSFVLIHPAYGEEKHFIASLGDWSDPDNWDPYGEPEENDDVYIDPNCECNLDIDFTPVLNNLTIEGELYDLSLFGCDIEVNYDLTVAPDGYLESSGSIKVWGNLNIEDDATFDGTVDAYNIYFGSTDPPGGGDFSVTFKSSVSVSNEIIVGFEYGYATVNFQQQLTVDGDVKVYDEMAIHGATTISGILSDEGTFKTYTDFTCSVLDITYPGTFESNGNYTYTITSRLEMDDGFQITQGTIKMAPTSSTQPASIYPADNSYIKDLIISGAAPTQIKQYVSSNNPLVVQGTLTIEENKTLDPNDWTIEISGNMVCNGNYTYDAGETPVVKFTANGNATLTGDVGFYDLIISSNTTLLTGEYIPSVAPATLTEDGYVQGNISCTDNVNSDDVFNLGNLGCVISQGSGLGLTTINRHTGATYTKASHSLTRWYEIDAASADPSVLLKLYYRDSELNGNGENSLNIWRYANGSWTKYVPTTRDASNNYVEATVEIPSGNSVWVLSDAEDDQSLPVELISFQAIPEQGNKIRLSWSTASEVNNAGFEIRKKSEDRTNEPFQTIAFVAGAGNSNMTHYYQYVDARVEKGKWYSYQLYSVDVNGAKELLATLSRIRIPDKEPVAQQIALFQNYPNPFNQSTQIQYYLPEENRVNLLIYDPTGRRIRFYRLGIQPAGYHTFVWDGTDELNRPVGSGTYFYILQTSGHSRAVRKMMLVR